MPSMNAMRAGLRAALLIATAPAIVAADGLPPYRDAKAPIEQRVDDLLMRLTLREKVSLMAGAGTFTTKGIERLGIPALQLADGPNGVRSNDDATATVFPVGSALAATWNPQVVQSVGEAIGREARALGAHVVLGPNVNIQRVPLAGRNFEAYSEDPHLAGKIGIGFVKGVQSQRVGVSVKHFVANEQELERMRSSSNVDERALREIYLRPFEMIVEEAQPWTVMAAYNRVNGTYMSEHDTLVRKVLKGEWGFDGVLMSDWGAVHSTVESANAGLDLEMPGPGKHYDSRLAHAVQNWQVPEHVVDDAVRRMLRMIIRTGAMDENAAGSGDLRSERNRSVARAAAAEAIVLLKNDRRNDRRILPFDPQKIRSLAVIGPNADVPLIQGGGSAAVIPGATPTPLTSLRNLVGSKVRLTYARGVDNDLLPPPADARLMSPDESRSEQGLEVAYYANATFQDQPVHSDVETYFDKTLLASRLGQMSARWEGYFWPPADGVYEWSLSQLGAGTLYLDGKKILAPDVGVSGASEGLFGAPRVASIDLKAGRSYRLRMEYVSLPVPFHSMRLGIRLPATSIEEAVQAARSADAAVVFVGVSRTSESEGRDRADMELVGRQNELVSAVLAANPNTVVVLSSGAPLALPWASQAPALVQAWLPGEEGATALAQILFGETSPSGKLPFTFPKRLEDNPAYLHYTAGRDANYGEGVFVGYRYYDTKKVEPLFAFGHGLSYTSFEYSDLRVPTIATADKSIDISVEVRNTGSRSGMEVVQLYVGDEATREVVRPVRELKGFQKIALAAGEKRTVRFTLNARDFAYYDTHADDWVSTPGLYRLYVGSASNDIRQQRQLELVVQQDPRRPPPDVISPLDMF